MSKSWIFCENTARASSSISKPVTKSAPSITHPRDNTPHPQPRSATCASFLQCLQRRQPWCVTCRRQCVDELDIVLIKFWDSRTPPPAVGEILILLVSYEPYCSQTHRGFFTLWEDSCWEFVGLPAILCF